MYEIDLSTCLLMGLSENKTKIITIDNEIILNVDVKKIIDISCRFFGSNLQERINMTKRLIKIRSKSPIVVEESRNIIFFPLRSTREKDNIWISFNNLIEYRKNGNETLLVFKNNIEISINFSYYILDNQVTRSMMLDYELKKRKEKLKIY